MKVLIASVGHRLESLVAKRFEHASWYLLVDAQTRSLEVLQHLTPHDRHTALQKAAAEGASVVVAERFGGNTLKLLRTHGMRVAQVHGIAAREVLDKLQNDAIPLVDVDVLAGGRGAVVATLQRLIPRRRGQKLPFGATAYNSDSPRGHHHLQQYAGRGH